MKSARRLPLAEGPGDALQSATGSWSSADVVGAADALTATLGSLPEVRAGSPVAHLFDLRPEAVVAIHAVARAGAVLAPAHPGWTDEQKLRFIDTVGPSVAVAAPGLPWPDGWERRPEAVPGFGEIDVLVRRDGSKRCADDPDGTMPPNAHSPTAARTPTARLLPAGTDVLISTSGSGGRPRVVCHSYERLIAAAEAANDRSGDAANDVTLATLAWAHVGGLGVAIRAAISGGCVACGPRRFEAAEVLEAINRHKVTQISVVPVMLERLIDASEDTARRVVPLSLDRVLVGGAGMPRPLLERAVSAGWPVALTYGLTEAGSQVATIPVEAVAKAVRQGKGIDVLNWPLDGAEIRVEPDGAVRVRAPGRMLRYLRGESGGEGRDRETDGAAVGATERVVDGAADNVADGGPEADVGDEWLPTGDYAALAADGTLDIVGRAETRLVSGGTNVDPEEVEAVLLGHPDVAAVCVVGVPDDRWGDLISAVVVPAPGAEDGSLIEDVASWVRERLDGPRVPRQWKLTPALPHTANGKLDRAAVRATMIDED